MLNSSAITKILTSSSPIGKVFSSPFFSSPILRHGVAVYDGLAVLFVLGENLHCYEAGDKAFLSFERLNFSLRSPFSDTVILRLLLFYHKSLSAEHKKAKNVRRADDLMSCVPKISPQNPHRTKFGIPSARRAYGIFAPAVLFSPDDGSYLPIRSAASCPIYGISESRKLIIEPNFRKIGLRY